MIVALCFYTLCIVLRAQDIPVWLDIILFIAGVISTCVAFTVWEHTKDRIRTLENKIEKMKGGQI